MLCRRGIAGRQVPIRAVAQRVVVVVPSARPGSIQRGALLSSGSPSDCHSFDSHLDSTHLHPQELHSYDLRAFSHRRNGSK